MRVQVEGIITSIEEKTSEERKYTEILLAQPGEKLQVTVRKEGHLANNYDLFELNSFSGRLILWRTRDGVGSMLIADNDE